MIGQYMGWVRTHLHQCGAGLPAGAGAYFMEVKCLHWCRSVHSFQFAEAPFRGTGSLIYQYSPISAPYSCGSRRRIAPWAISAGTRCGGTADSRRCKQHHTISTNRSTVEPASGIRTDAPHGFPRWYKCPSWCSLWRVNQTLAAGLPSQFSLRQSCQYYITLEIAVSACMSGITQLTFCLLFGLIDWTISQIQQCMGQMSQNAPFCNRNVHISAPEWCIVRYGTGAL